MTLPGSCIRPLLCCRRLEYGHGTLKLRRSIPEYPNLHSGPPGQTMAQETAAFFNPYSASQGSDSTGSSTRKPLIEAKKILRREAPREHNMRELYNPVIPAISEEDLEGGDSLIRPHHARRGAAEVLKLPSTPTSTADTTSPQLSKQQRMDGSASLAASSPTSSLSGAPWSSAPSPSPRQIEKMEGIAYKKRQEWLKRASVDGNTRGICVIDWTNGVPMSRVRAPSPSLHVQIHNTTIQMRKLTMDDLGP